jgi:glycosyltransferase involved in cell wall biosynthesis
MNKTRISIITPSFNQGHFIEETINSVLKQQHNELEYMVIDGGSNDSTVSIIKKYEKQLAYWISEKDTGQSNAINKGYKKATGDIVNWLNSDDYYETNCLDYIANQFSDDKISCYCGISRVFGEGQEYFSAGTDIYPDNLHKTIGWARIDQPETFFRRSAINEIGFLNENLHYVMDRDLWIRYICKYGLEGIKKDKQLLVHFRLHGASKTVSQQEKFMQEHYSLYYTYALLNDLEEYAAILEDLFKVKQLSLQYLSKDLQKADWEKIINYFILHQGLQAYAANDFIGADRILKKVKKHLLAKVDADELFKITLRIKIVPPRIKKWWNKMTAT